MNRTRPLTILALILLVASTTAALAGPSTRVANAIWAHGRIYDTVAIANAFRQPPSHSVDLLYNFSMSGLMGQRSVSESAPGDTDYNGGRWWVQMVVFTDAGLAEFDANHDGYVDYELTSAEDVLEQEALGNVEIHETAAYFSCPLNRAQ